MIFDQQTPLSQGLAYMIDTSILKQETRLSRVYSSHYCQMEGLLL